MPDDPGYNFERRLSDVATIAVLQATATSHAEQIADLRSGQRDIARKLEEETSSQRESLDSFKTEISGRLTQSDEKSAARSNQLLGGGVILLLGVIINLIVSIANHSATLPK